MLVGFSKPKKFKLFSYLVQKILRIPYSHVYLIFEIRSEDIMIHANYKGVNALSHKQFLKDNELIDVFEVTDSFCEISAWLYAINHLGKPYSFWNILAIWLGIRLKDGERRFICSELVIRALGIHASVPDNATPKDVYEYLSSLKAAELQ